VKAVHRGQGLHNGILFICQRSENVGIGWNRNDDGSCCGCDGVMSCDVTCDVMDVTKYNSLFLCNS
jgi:hypothetical protein